MAKATIYIFGLIGKDTTLADVTRQLKWFDSPTELQVIINSAGGSVEEGDKIYDYLKNIEKEMPVTTVTDKAYSIAAKIFAAGSTRIVEDIEKAIMIHFAWARAEGGADELEEIVNELRILEDGFSNFYAEFLGIEKEEASKLLSNNTFISGEEAVKMGFATEMKSTAKAVAEYNVNINEKKEMAKEEKKIKKGLVGALMGAFADVFKEFGVQAEMTLQDSSAKDIIFPDLEVGSTPAVGDKATVDGVAISDGEYIMPSLDNQTLVFKDGAITEIKPKVEDPAPSEVVAEEDVQEINVWTMTITSTSFNVGDVLKYKDWDGNEQTVGSGEFQREDGTRVVTDATGTIVLVKPASPANEPPVEVVPSASFKAELDKIKEEFKAQVEVVVKQVEAKEKEINDLRSKIGSKEVFASEIANEGEGTTVVDENYPAAVLCQTKRKN